MVAPFLLSFFKYLKIYGSVLRFSGKSFCVQKLLPEKAEPGGKEYQKGIKPSVVECEYFIEPAQQ
ncbi:MAG: hypothetical protein DRR16_22660 [Candidatus Parabeggiatoa sp. nov. 3]|nr:MAG: hypothetical protein DRR00_25765 [Gammaproteobacteria bacterium]RKZ60330.1 MAG: hypothetical protein DRQ99_22265 [Gammaproteobacteria bacterium]RKZ81117.1 MAG: hypothetical protein DRR16_22660 [Gammaproteobacteria bacterium]